jgi:hypothetical protein
VAAFGRATFTILNPAKKSSRWLAEVATRRKISRFPPFHPAADSDEESARADSEDCSGHNGRDRQRARHAIVTPAPAFQSP